MDKYFDIKCLNKKNIVVDEVDVFLKNNKLSGEFDIYYVKSENKYIYSDKDRSKVLGVVDFDMEESRWVVVHLREKTKDVRESQNGSKATRTRDKSLKDRLKSLNKKELPKVELRNVEKGDQETTRGGKHSQS